MNRHSHDESEGVSDWLQEAIDKMPDPSPERLARFDHLKEDFVQAFQRAYRTNTLAEVVFSVSGRLLEAAQGIVAGLQASLGGEPAYAPVGVRSATARGQQEPVKRNLVARAQKASGDCLIEALTFKELECTRLEINLIEKKTGRLRRPFDVSVKDEQGRSVVKDIHVAEDQTGASFSGPAAGFYLFDIRWAGGNDTVSIRFQEQD